MEIVLTEKKGFGLRANADIPKCASFTIALPPNNERSFTQGHLYIRICRRRG